jgi:hypothetical protein
MVSRYPLGDQVGDIGRVFGIVFVPAPVQKLPVALDRHPGDQDHHPAALNQMLSQRLVIVGRRFQAKDRLGQTLGHLDGPDLGQQLLKSLDGIVKDQSFEKGK